MHQRAIRRGVGLRTQDAADIQTQDEDGAYQRLGQVGGEQVPQRVPVDPSVFEGFIQTGSLALKAGRLGQFHETAGLGVGQEGIGDIKQGIAGLREAGRVQLLAERRQDGTIHGRTSLLVMEHHKGTPTGRLMQVDLSARYDRAIPKQVGLV